VADGNARLLMITTNGWYLGSRDPLSVHCVDSGLTQAAGASKILAGSHRRGHELMQRISIVLTLVLAFVGVATWVQPADASTTCSVGQSNGPKSIAPLARVNWLSAELGWDGRLRDRPYATGGGPWEQFEFVCLDWQNSIYAIRSLANNRYVSAELSLEGDDYGLLRARAAAIGPWEQFRFVPIHYNSDPGVNNPWQIAIQSTANGFYVSTEIGWTGDRDGLLRARATVIGEWEQYFTQD
jgi:hypothetical protein